MAGSMVSSCCWLEEVEGSGWDVLSFPLPSRAVFGGAGGQKQDGEEQDTQAFHGHDLLM